MDSITLENYRCFREKQKVRLAPLTLLVGENSTGKTSVLALIRALQEMEFEGIFPNFKKGPYDLGSFDEIAHYRGGRGGRAEDFKAGFDFTVEDLNGESELIKSSYEVLFSSRGTAPFPIKRRLDFGEVWVEEKIVTEHSKENIELHFGIKNNSWKLSGFVGRLRTALYRQDIAPLSGAMRYILFRTRELSHENPENPTYEVVAGYPHPSDEDVKLLEKYADLSLGGMRRYNRRCGQRVLASAPVRSEPLRTYDPVPVEHDPGGRDAPHKLAEIQDEEIWMPLKELLQNFGKASGLFDEIAVRRLGKRSSDPFQIQIKKYGAKAKGPNRNLIDVGYGVSQVLPVLIDFLSSELPTIFLTQQPEIHLHPMAQAALGSLFCQVASLELGHQLVIETHSDYILDRIRINVRDRLTGLRPEDVSILYFESDNLDVKIHSLELDENGGLIGAPPNYREFFRIETRNFLGL